MTYYYQYKYDDHYSKIYDDNPTRSGSTLPYTFGWNNKFSPNPFGNELVAENFSWSADTGLRNPSNSKMPTALLGDGDTFLARKFLAGPVNGIYEVIISGITGTTGAGHCLNCNEINDTYLLYYTPNYLGAITNAFGDIDNSLSWKGHICNKNKIGSLCFYDNISMTLNQILIASGGHSIKIRIPSILSNVSDITRDIVFNKNFNYTFAFREYDNKKPLMLEDIIVLSGVPSTPTTYDYTCDISNATATVRPYKSKYYDIKNQLSIFYSGFAMPLNDNGFPGEGSYCTNYLFENNVNATYIIGDDSLPNGYYEYNSPLMSVRLDNVKSSGNLPWCVDCSGFYEQPINLLLGGNTYFSRVGIAKNRITQEAITFADSTNYNYYNLCNFACDNNHGHDFQGPCNNFLRIETTYNFTNLSVGSGIMFLHFGAIMSSGGSSITRYASKKFRKVICDNSTANKCVDSTYTLIGFPGSTFTRGTIDCFNPSNFSRGWTLENETLPGILPDYLDVTRYCDFSSSDVVIDLPTIPSIPCNRTCTYCDGTNVATTATLRVYNNYTDGNHFDITMILDSTGPGMSGVYDRTQGGGCITSYDDGINSAVAGFLVNNNGYAVANIDLRVRTESTGIFPTFGLYYRTLASGINNGGNNNIYINCGSTLNGSVFVENQFDGVGFTARYLYTELTFHDTYNILDYL